MNSPNRNNIEVKVTHDFNVPAERVFDAWTKPDLVRAWWGFIESPGGKLDIRRVEIDARVGGRYTFSDMRSEGEAVHWGIYKVLDRPNKLVYSFFTSEEEEKEDNSTVTMIFAPTNEGCRVELAYEMDAKWAEYTEQTKKGWAKMLKGLDAYLHSM